MRKTIIVATLALCASLPARAQDAYPGLTAAPFRSSTGMQGTEMLIEIDNKSPDVYRLITVRCELTRPSVDKDGAVFDEATYGLPSLKPGGHVLDKIYFSKPNSWRINATCSIVTAAREAVPNFE